MGPWRVLQWNLLGWRSEPALPSTSPLELEVPGRADPGNGDWVGDLHAGRIPDRCLPLLSDAARWPGLAGVLPARVIVIGFVLFFPVLALSRWIDGLEPSEGGPMGRVARWFTCLMLGTLLFLVVRSVCAWLLRRWRVARDLRDRCLRVEEGEVIRKWRRSTWTTEPGVAGASKEDRDEYRDAHRWVLRESVWAQIGRRTLPIGSHALFARLGSGIRYRMYLSAQARQLLAIESVELEFGAGYRRAPPRTTTAEKGD